MGWATGCMEQWILEHMESYGTFENECMVILYDDMAKLLKDARFHYKEVSQEAKDIGSQVHGIIERHIKTNLAGKIPVYLELNKDPAVNPDEVHNGYNAFLEWEKKFVVRYIETEQTIFHAQELFGGTLDCIAELKDGIYCIDFKASKGFYDGYGKQVASYKFARESVKEPTTLNVKTRDDREFSCTLNPIKIDGIGVLRLDKETGQPEWKDYSSKYDRKIKSFLALLDFWYKDKNRQLKGNDRAKKLKAT
ncbi:MAG TPA: hypothetical protein ENI08_00790 [Candidatus Dependentiae bacterium]|nr:hypothetical protein [Candidatus Dependentiae bacterium]